MYQSHGRSLTAPEPAGPPAPAPADPPSGAVRAGQIDTSARPPLSGAGGQPALVALASPSQRGISRRTLERQCGTDAAHPGAILAVPGRAASAVICSENRGGLHQPVEIARLPEMAEAA